MIRKRDIAVLALCGAIATCAYSEKRHRQELASLRTQEIASPVGTPAKPSPERTRQLKALMEMGSVSDASRAMRRNMASDSVWYGLDVLDVPKDRVKGFVEDEPAITRTVDSSCACTSGIRGGMLPPAPTGAKLSKTDFELVPFAEWEQAMIGRTYTKGWSIMLNGPRASLHEQRMVLHRIVDRLKARFRIDPKAQPYPMGIWQNGGEAFVITFSKPGSNDGRIQSRILDSVVVATGRERAFLGIRMREGVSPDGVIRGSHDPLA